MIGLDQCRQGGVDLLLVHGFLHVEIQPAFRGRYVPAGHPERDQRADEMHGRVHAHVDVAPVPVDGGGDSGARFGQSSPFGRDVPDRAGLPVPGLHDLRTAAVPADRAGVARLATAEGIKHRAVQDDGAVVHGDDLRPAFLQVGIFDEQFLGHGRGSCG